MLSLLLVAAILVLHAGEGVWSFCSPARPFTSQLRLTSSCKASETPLLVLKSTPSPDSAFVPEVEEEEDELLDKIENLGKVCANFLYFFCCTRGVHEMNYLFHFPLPPILA